MPEKFFDTIMNTESVAFKHLSLSNEHYTPLSIIEAAKGVFKGGTIDLDPASHEIANATVKANKYFTIADDGLYKDWEGRVWVNPPGGRLEKTDPACKKFNTKSRAVAWWRKLSQEYEKGKITEAIFLAFNIELLCNGQDKSGRFWSPLDSNTICFPRRRIRFTGSSPTHANVILHLGNLSSSRRFSQEFKQFGSVVSRDR